MSNCQSNQGRIVNFDSYVHRFSPNRRDSSESIRWGRVCSSIAPKRGFVAEPWFQLKWSLIIYRCSFFQEEIKEWLRSIGTSSLAKRQTKQVLERADDNKVSRCGYHEATLSFSVSSSVSGLLKESCSWMKGGALIRRRALNRGRRLLRWRSNGTKIKRTDIAEKGIIQANGDRNN